MSIHYNMPTLDISSTNSQRRSVDSVIPILSAAIPCFSIHIIINNSPIQPQPLPDSPTSVDEVPPNILVVSRGSLGKHELGYASVARGIAGNNIGKNIEAGFAVAMFHVLDWNSGHFDFKVQNRIGCRLEVLVSQARNPTAGGRYHSHVFSKVPVIDVFW